MGSALCTEQATRVPLPAVAHETSGVAVGRRNPHVIWTHNDSGGDPLLYAVDARGHLLGQVWVSGARNVDWEDMALAGCGETSCLYIADIGDNAESRPDVVVYRVSEPDLADGETESAQAFRMRYPDGPRDAEAVFVLPGEKLYIVSKGRSDVAGVYRYPGELRADAIVTLERAQALTGPRPSLANQVTGASSSWDGTLVAVRTYTSLRIHGVEDGVLTEQPLLSQSLRTLEEPQGEAVDLGTGGLVVVTSEAGPASAPSMSLLRCRIRGQTPAASK